MKTTEWDRIVTSAPLNREASIVRDGSGDLYDVKTINSYVNPLPMKPITIAIRKSRGFVDYTGRLIGRVRLLGLYDKTGKHKASWVGKCVCGHYMTAVTKTVRLAAEGAHELQCGYCDVNRAIRKGTRNKGLTTAEVIERRKQRPNTQQGAA